MLGGSESVSVGLNGNLNLIMTPKQVYADVDSISFDRLGGMYMLLVLLYTFSCCLYFFNIPEMHRSTEIDSFPEVERAIA